METRATHAEQHYVPEFLLKAWHSEKDNKLVQYKWVPQKLDIQHYSAKAVAKERHLYSTTLPTGERDTRIEKDYLGPEIDNKAAPVLQRILTGGVEGLDGEQREIWVRFLVAQMVRVPSMIQHFAEFARREFAKGIDAIVRQPGRSKFGSYAEEHAPYAGANAAVEMLEDVIESDRLCGALLDTSWHAHRLRWSKVDLLIGDRPLLQVGPMAENFLIVLPISPRVLFCAASHEGTLEKMKSSDHTGVAKTLNKDSAMKASKYVYATDVSQTAVVERYLPNRLTTNMV